MSNAVSLTQREKLVLSILNLLDVRAAEVQTDLLNEIMGLQTQHGTSREHLSAMRSFIEDARRIILDLRLSDGRAS